MKKKFWLSLSQFVGLQIVWEIVDGVKRNVAGFVLLKKKKMEIGNWGEGGWEKSAAAD